MSRVWEESYPPSPAQPQVITVVWPSQRLLQLSGVVPGLSHSGWGGRDQHFREGKAKMP